MICIVPVTLVLVWIWLRFITRYPERTIRDVYPFFHRVEAEIVNGAFHPEPEAEYKATHSKAEFRLWQFRRIHFAIHLCNLIAANSRLLQRWAVHERRHNWSLLPEEFRKGLRGCQVAAVQSRTAALAVRFRLRFRLLYMTLLPFLPAPSFSSLVDHTSALIEFYGTAETLADALSIGYGEDIHQEMSAVLGMVDLDLNGQE